jgi:excisionase family DNA binding protein
MMESGQAVLVGPNGNKQPIPAEVHALFLRVLQVLQSGKAISIVPYMQELTTQDAAHLLGVSRQYLVRLLDSGGVPFHKVGTHRRIYLRDLLQYRQERDRERRAALSDLARMSLEACLYDNVENDTPSE